MKSIIIYWIRVTLYYIFRIFPVQWNKIFIINFNGKGYGDNPKYIVEELLKKNLNLNIVWCIKDSYQNNFPKSIRLVRYKSIRAIFEEVTARVWIDNCRKQLYVRKRKNQFYIQAWHGGLGLKKCEKDIEENLSAYYVKQAKNDSRLIDIILSNSDFCTQLYRRAFWYNGNIAEFGHPRDDILINKPENIKEKVFSHFSLDKNKSIILYAPTFRNDSDTNIYDIDYSSVLNGFESITQKEWVILIRLHPNISEKSNQLRYSNKIINATLYDDMQELMLASDILITDYSSIVFEFMLMYKPVFLYTKDYNNYLKKERSFYFDLFSLPFPYAHDNIEFLDKIKTFDSAAYINKLNMLFNEVKPVLYGKASEKTADLILEKIGKPQKGINFEKH